MLVKKFVIELQLSSLYPFHQPSSTHIKRAIFTDINSTTQPLFTNFSSKLTNSAKLRGITALHFKVRGVGGMKAKAPGPGSQAAIRALARSGLAVGRIEDVTPVPTDTCRASGGHRGRRL